MAHTQLRNYPTRSPGLDNLAFFPLRSKGTSINGGVHVLLVSFRSVPILPLPINSLFLLFFGSMHHFNSLVLILQMGNASLIHIRITGVLSVFKLKNRLTAAACHVRRHSLKQKRVDLKQSYLARPAYTAYTMVGRVGLAYPKHGNSTEFHQGMYPTPMETIVQLMRLEDSSKTKQISHSAPPCLESWPGKNSMRNPGGTANF